MTLVHKHQGTYDLQGSAKEGLAHGHAFHTAVAAEVEKEGTDQILGIVPYGQMGKMVFPAQLEQAPAPQPGTAKAGAVAQILFRMPLQAVIRHFNVACYAVFGKPAAAADVTMKSMKGAAQAKG